MTSFFAVGLGCDSRTPLETLRAALEQALARAGIAPGHIVAAASITLKAKEPGLLAVVALLHARRTGRRARAQSVCNRAALHRHAIGQRGSRAAGSGRRAAARAHERAGGGKTPPARPRRAQRHGLHRARAAKIGRFAQ